MGSCIAALCGGDQWYTCIHPNCIGNKLRSTRRYNIQKHYNSKNINHTPTLDNITLVQHNSSAADDLEGFEDEFPTASYHELWPIETKPYDLSENETDAADVKKAKRFVRDNYLLAGSAIACLVYRVIMKTKGDLDHTVLPGKEETEHHLRNTMHLKKMTYEQRMEHCVLTRTRMEHVHKAGFCHFYGPWLT